MVKNSDDFADEEIARRRDAVIRKMANTAPQPHATPKASPKKVKISGGGRGLSRKRSRPAASAKRKAEC